MGFTAIVDISTQASWVRRWPIGALYDVAMQRPDKLRVHLVAIADAPPSLEAALQQAHDKAAIYYPFTDLLLPDPYKAFTNKVLHAFYIGPSGAVGGVATEAVAWAAMTSSSDVGSAPKTSCRGAFARCLPTTRSSCATTCN
ncbi:MAG: DUF2092 domain-containing protein [Betaproteobacteria bacterium]|nr:DUF2092 domain-containing protein [Betaproteobacteria bacterium]